MFQGLPRQLLIATLPLLATTAAAEIMDANEFMTIEVSSATGTGTYAIPIGDWSGENSTEWQMAPGPITIVDDTTGAPLAQLAGGAFELQYMPNAKVGFDFTIVALDEAIEVSAQSPQLNFDAVSDPGARASVSFELVDANDGFAQMTSTAEPIGTGAYRGRYNGSGDGGALFSHLIWQMSISGTPGQPAGTINSNRNYPNFGFESLGTDVDSLSVDISYSLTPGDALIASGSMQLDTPVVPEPATLTLFALAGIGLLSRRR